MSTAREKSRWSLLPVVAAFLYVGSALWPGRVLLPIDMLRDAGPWKADPGMRFPVSNSLLSDPVHQFHPWDVAARQALREGQIPWTNPLAGEGEPLWGNPQAALLSPFTWPRLIFGLRGWALCVLLKLIVGGLGAFAFARALGASSRAAAFSGLVYELSGFSIVWGLHPHTNVFSVLPWLGWAACRGLARPSSGTTAAVVAASAFATAGGHPETLALGVVGLAVFLMLEVRSRRAEVERPAPIAILMASAAGFLLLALQLVPFAILLARSEYLQTRAGASAGGGLRIYALAGQILPGFLGSPLQGEIDLTGAFAGSENFNVRSGGFIGLVVLLVIGLALRDLPRAMRRGLLVGVVALAVSWRIPPLGWIWTLPILKLFASEYVALVFVLFASLAAGPAVEIVSRGPTRLARFAGIGLVAAGLPLMLGGAILALPAGRAALERSVRAGVARLRESGYLKKPAEFYEGRMAGYIDRGAATVRRRYALPGVVWIVAGAALLSRRRPAWLLASAGVAELAAFGYGYLPAVPLSAVPAAPPAVTDLRRLISEREGLLAASWETYAADLPTLDGLRDVRSNSLLESRTAIARLSACAYVPRFVSFPEVLGEHSVECLERLGVRYFASRSSQPHARRVGGLDPPGVGVYELPDARRPAGPVTGPPNGTTAGMGLTLAAAFAAVVLMRRAPRRRGPEIPRSRGEETGGARNAVPRSSTGNPDGESSSGR